MARARIIDKVSRDFYDDLDLAVKELGTLWVLDRVNEGIKHNRKVRDRMRAQRAVREEQDHNVSVLQGEILQEEPC